MKNRFLNVFFGVILMGAFMTSCAKQVYYAVYKNVKPDLSFEWQFPSEWNCKEFGVPSLGFAGVVFAPESQSAKIFNANFVVTVKKAEAFALSSATLDAVAEDTAKRSASRKDARILKRSTLKVAGVEASLIDVEYKGRTRIYSPGAESVMLREQIIIVAHAKVFYVIRYVNDKKKFSQFLPYFKHALKTFSFLKP